MIDDSNYSSLSSKENISSNYIINSIINSKIKSESLSKIKSSSSSSSSLNINSDKSKDQGIEIMNQFLLFQKVMKKIMFHLLHLKIKKVIVKFYF